MWKKIGFRDEKSVSPLSSRKDQNELKSLNEQSFSNKNYQTITRSRFRCVNKQDQSRSNSKDNNSVIVKSRIFKDEIKQMPSKKKEASNSGVRYFKAATSNDLSKQDIPMSNSFIKRFQGNSSKLLSPITSNNNLKKRKTFSRDALNQFELINQMINIDEKKKSQNQKITILQKKLIKYQQITKLYKKEIKKIKNQLQQFLKITKNSMNKYKLMIQTFFYQFHMFNKTSTTNTINNNNNHNNNHNQTNFINNQLKNIKQKQNSLLEREKQFKKMVKIKEEEFHNIIRQIENRQKMVAQRQNSRFNHSNQKKHIKHEVAQESTKHHQQNKKHIQSKLLQLKSIETQLTQKRKQLHQKQNDLLRRTQLLHNKQKQLSNNRDRRNSNNIQNQSIHNIPLVKRLNDMKTSLDGITICNQQFQKTLLKQTLRRSKQIKQQHNNI